MKKIFSNGVTVFLIIAAGVVFIFDGFQSKLLPEGSVAPEFELDKLGGGRVALSSLKGQVVLLDFWASWCEPCREEMPWLVPLAKEYESKGVTFVAAASPDDERPDVGIYAKDTVPGLAPYAAFADPAMGNTYRIAALPTLYIIGRDGKVTASKQGSTSEWRVRRWLNAALEAK